MQFKVPQFLDIEDKIFGPFTFSEFVYLAGGGGLCFIVYRAWGLLLGAVPILIIAGFSLALVFYKPNDKPFVEMLEAAFKFVFQDKLYIWKRALVKKEAKPKANPVMNEFNNKLYSSVKQNSSKSLSGEKLRDLAWSLDVLDIKKENN